MSKNVVVAVFPSRMLLTKALEHITNVRDVAVKRAAVVAKAASGETIVLDDNLGAMEGGVIGGVVGGILVALGLIQFGVLTLPLSVIAPVMFIGMLFGVMLGVLIGRFATDLVTIPFRNVYAEAFSHQLQTGRLALVLELQNDRAMMARLVQELNLFQAEFISRDDLSNNTLDRAA